MAESALQRLAILAVILISPIRSGGDRAAPGVRAGRRDFLVIEFEEVPGGAAGDGDQAG